MALQKDMLVLKGKYRIVRLLGEGASAEVYLAEQTLLRADQALKMLKRDVAGASPAKVEI